MNNTLQYYNQYAADFTADTQSSDMTEKYASFLNRVKTGGHILDLGCGSGRDSLQFLKRGYTVTSVDGSEELCRIAEAYTGQKVHHMLFDEISWQNEFDGVWACASLLHCTIEELPMILQKVTDSLKPGGVLYLSFKYGDFAGWKNGRYFTYLTEESLKRLLTAVSELHLEEISLNGDVRPGREHEIWLNAVAWKRIELWKCKLCL